MLQSVRQVFLSSLLTLALYFSGFFSLFTPLPLFYLSLYRTKRRWALSFLSVSLLAVLVSILFPSHAGGGFGLVHFFFYLLVALVLSLGIFQRWSLLSLGLRGGLGITSLLLSLAFLCHAFGVLDPFALLQTAVIKTQTLLDEMIQKPEFLKNRTEVIPFILQMKQGVTLLPKLVPSLLFIYVILVISLNVGALHLFSHKKSDRQSFGYFQHLEIPHLFVWILIGSGLFFFGDVYLFQTGWLKVISLNVVLASLFAYFIQGFSILAFFLKRFSPLFRLAIYGLVFLFLQLFGLVVVGLGVADVWIDFRKLKVKSE